MITPRQRSVLAWVDTFVREHGYGPSYDEIRVGVGLASKGTVHGFIERLRERGMIAPAQRHLKRGLRLTRPGQQILRMSANAQST